MKKLIFQKDGQDILSGIDLKLTKALPFGGECHDVFHLGVKIAEIHFGTPAGEVLEGYSWRFEDD